MARCGDELVSAVSDQPVAVEVRGLRRAFGERVVLDDLDFEIRRSEFVALVGKSGGGKTTLLRTLAGLDAPGRGSVSVPAKRSIVFQEPRLLAWKPVWRNVAIGLPRGVGRELAVKALTEVGLGGHLNAWPLTLSGGEAQRAALARALVREPELLLLDEPFGALDAITRIQMHELVRELHRRHRPAVLLVTHDVEEALVLADRVIVLRDGRVDEQLITRELFHDRLDPGFEGARRRVLELLGVHEVPVEAGDPALAGASPS
jgi:sulfonate transport system ATP-binding protein